jgi:hypothetical protein
MRIITHLLCLLAKAPDLRLDHSIYIECSLGVSFHVLTAKPVAL